jgi:hypothetical protein
MAYGTSDRLVAGCFRAWLLTLEQAQALPNSLSPNVAGGPSGDERTVNPAAGFVGPVADIQTRPLRFSK